ncbi:MAG: NAD-dependent epimerase/dehydratase family protein [Gemmatimonadetes bacterium]|jgi:UDP-glucose 4-epimerase|nr:NAD-dependent epimerase/dehydratase family protein [Gemmatimonadota bacterium]MBT4612609.1 NAD-dependent epimerase/dehydratase family protein [Gemmatimonadota bacterium]MBT5060696.1 NAD-dependent epimerase/dehydratase family protein [Gemmatimonadota bacterium]MBT5145394.1 NAD-dependent epimerase/dehydratase family protein [Gemmatimonadota bacterium]MBT5591582.1 NAD-dependent epimerase/dehydratase family protein [Gemmatimonadota bacterium]
MKVLITGGAGFIGSHLAERHLSMGDEVDIIDNLSTSDMTNVQHLESHENCNCVIDDILNVDVMRKLVSGCDLIYHLAAAVGVEYVLQNPLQTLTTNIRGTEIVLELANEQKKRVVLLSTSEIYGKKNGHVPFREDSDRILGPTTVVRWSYSTTKAVDELLALAYWREKRLPTTIVRPFNVIGPRQTGRYGMVVPRFIRQALLGDPITVYDNGEQTRCWTYIDDAVDGLIALAQSDDAAGEILNLGSNFESSIKDLAIKIKAQTNSDSEIAFIPFSETRRNGLYEDLVYRAPDLEKIRGLVGYDPKVDLDEALRRIIEDFQK